MTPAWKRIAFALATLLAPALGAGCSGTSGGTCTVGGKTYSYGQSFPDEDNCNTCSCSAQGVACTTRACVDSGAPEVGAGDASAGDLADRGASDASEGGSPDVVADAGGGDAGGGSCTLTDTYRFGRNGGFVAFQGESTLSPPAQYRHVRMTFTGTPTRVTECAPALPACGAPGIVTLADITRDLADADVRAAFALTKPPLYGVDTRPVDGTVYMVTRADGHGVIVGRPCSAPAPAGCPAIPPGVQALAQHLQMLDDAQLAKPECASLANP